jgi:hypothetical protein
VSVLLRLVSSVKATLKRTMPLPVPLVALVIVIQLAWLVAVHAQVGSVSISISRAVAPRSGTVTANGDTLKVQVGGGGIGAPACVTDTGVPATVSDPVRPVVAAWLATT